MKVLVTAKIMSKKGQGGRRGEVEILPGAVCQTDGARRGARIELRNGRGSKVYISQRDYRSKCKQAV